MSNIIHARWLLIVLTLASLLLTQCGFGRAEPTPAPVTLSWATWQENSAVEVELMKRYREQFPNITFQRQGMQLGENMADREPALDLVNVLVNYDFLRASKAGSYVDLTELWNDGGLNTAIPHSFQQLTEQENKQFLVPAAFDWSGIYYNKAVFEQYQLQPPQSWDDLARLCDQLLLNNEIPFALAGDGFTIRLWFDYLLLRVGGMQFYRDLIDGKVSYQDIRVQDAIDRWQTLLNQGCFVEDAKRYDDQSAIKMLVRDDKGMLGSTKAAMMLVDAFTFTQLPEKLRQGIDFFRFPQIMPDVPQAEIVAITGYAIPTKSVNSSQALDFLKFMATQESQEAFLQEAFVSSALLAPVRNDIAADKMSEDMKQAVQLVNESESVAPLSFVWMPTEMIGRTELAYRKLLDNDWDFIGFVELLEEARQSALESGLFTQE
ncbi:MAG: ABC transporter substrate-binding protein [Caldilineaceae bacterium]